MIRGGPLLIVLLLLAGCGPASDGDAPGTRTPDFAPDGRWIGNAVCYGPHRDGQRPGGPDPTTAQLREDLDLMLPHWNLLRNYGAGDVAARLLQVIRDGGLDMKVMLGVWIAPDAPAANRDQTAGAIRLARQYEDIVIAVCVGNETQVDWSAHRSSPDSLVVYVKQVRAGVVQPVTVADDFNFWNKPDSRAVAREIDFITMHAHPMWNGKQLDEALDWVAAQVDTVQALHPDRLVVLGETGWATSVADHGEQARLIKGRPGETEQAVFHAKATAWARQQRQPMFFFEVFDENWKGGDDPAEVEKHWGLFRADRKPKAAQAATAPNR